MSNDDQHYAVGKGKPPREHQFKKGQASPNPRGRPKGSSRQSQLERMLEKKVWVSGPDGRRVRRPVQEVIDHRLVETAAKGDLKAIKLVNELVILHAKYQLTRQPSPQEVQRQLAQDAQQQKANKWARDTIMEYLELIEEMKRYGVVVFHKGKPYLESWVIDAAAKLKPEAWWAKRRSKLDEQYPTSLGQPWGEEPAE